jgi:hypothetical protein
MKPAEVTMPAPARMTKMLNDAAYDVELVIRRRDRSTADPDALTMPFEIPIGADEQRKIQGLIAASQEGDEGPKFGPPAE